MAVVVVVVAEYVLRVLLLLCRGIIMYLLLYMAVAVDTMHRAYAVVSMCTGPRPLPRPSRNMMSVRASTARVLFLLLLLLRAVHVHATNRAGAMGGRLRSGTNIRA